MSLQRISHLTCVLLAAVALFGFGPVSASAATSPAPSPDSTHPLVMQRAANEVATAKLGPLQPFVAAPPQAAVGAGGGLQREVFGFALASSLSDPTFGYPTWDFSLLSTVAFFGLHVQDNGTLAADAGWNVWNSSQLSSLLAAAHSRGVKVVVTIILQDFDPGTPHICAGLLNGTATVNYIVAQVQAKGVDGVNLDYEGLNGSCGSSNPSWARDAFTNFTALLRSKLPAGSYLSVDTYASSATDPLGFFNVAGLNASVDSFFVMAYDLEYSNASRPPLNCSSFCLGPTAPLSGYYYNDTTTANQYINTVPASKVILGVPYYGRKACVAGPSANAYPTGAVTADNYLDASTELSAPGPGLVPGSYVAHRDANDPAGQVRWDTWTNTQFNCTRELYWDDAVSLGLKYDLVNSSNLRGVGIWTLNYGGGAPELWATLNSHFSCPVQINLPTSSTTTGLSVGLSAGSCAVAYFDLEQSDTTMSQGWFALKSVPASGGAIANGYAGHTYQFRARAHTKAGVVGSWSFATTQVPPTATKAHPWSGLYTLDGYGGINYDDSPPLAGSAYWAGWSIARTAKSLPGASAPQSGFVLDGFGGLHQYGSPVINETLGAGGHYWGWNIARDFAFMPDGTGGFVLDGFGGLHPFKVNGSTTPLQAQGNSYWGWDIARKVVIFPDGTGGYTLDGWGGIHPFGINGAAPVSTIASNTYWPGWDIAHDIVLVPGNGNRSGYVLDGYGGLHPFHPTTDASTMPASIKTAYWGWDIGRAVWFLPGSASAGYVLDGWGGLNPFGGAPAITSSSYWAGSDIGKALWGA